MQEGGQTIGTAAAFKDSRSIVERLKFSKTDDVYFFQGDDTSDLVTKTGYIYKFKEEIDFAVNRIRAPPKTSWDGIKFMKGTMSLENDTLVRKYVSVGIRDGAEWYFNWEVRLRFSKDFKTCSVVGLSWNGGNVTAQNKPPSQYRYTLKKAVECVVS
jgi:hypothetical protein